jgi:hypothetical protein
MANVLRARELLGSTYVAAFGDRMVEPVVCFEQYWVPARGGFNTPTTIIHSDTEPSSDDDEWMPDVPSQDLGPFFRYE